jgi:regulator of sirC expression with transglutaminase-like and TPR domain
VNWFSNEVEFQRLCQGRRDVDLVALSGEFACDAYPQLDLTPTLDELDRLGRAAREAVCRLPSTAGTADRLRAVSDVLYDIEGFAGNEDDYYDPCNSYINDVVRRRRGIPISLAVVYADVARRAGVPTFGVGAPGHFVLASADPLPAVADEPWFIDPFSGGSVLTPAQCIELIEDRNGRQFRVSLEHLRPTSAWEIGLRMLRNLKLCHAKRNAWQAALPVQQRLVMLLPNLAVERRDLGLIYLRCGEPRRALEQLEPYAQNCPEEEQVELAGFVKAARRLAAELN